MHSVHLVEGAERHQWVRSPGELIMTQQRLVHSSSAKKNMTLFAALLLCHVNSSSGIGGPVGSTRTLASSS